MRSYLFCHLHRRKSEHCPEPYSFYPLAGHATQAAGSALVFPQQLVFFYIINIFFKSSYTLAKSKPPLRYITCFTLVWPAAVKMLQTRHLLWYLKQGFERKGNPGHHMFFLTAIWPEVGQNLSPLVQNPNRPALMFLWGEGAWIPTIYH